MVLHNPMECQQKKPKPMKDHDRFHIRIHLFGFVEFSVLVERAIALVSI